MKVPCKKCGKEFPKVFLAPWGYCSAVCERDRYERYPKKPTKGRWKWGTGKRNKEKPPTETLKEKIERLMSED